jgi:hypothetical protein
MALAYDNPFGRGARDLAPGQNGGGGWWMPRYQWWALWPLASYGAGKLIEHTTPLGAKKAQAASLIATRVAPHFIGYALHDYGVSKDWLFDAADGSLPFGLTAAGSNRERIAFALAWSAAIAVMRCDASP